ncbi:MAG: extracellular solute-binding protein [Clostridia bacterium]|nr:extracellular solute-binding protein [Clostridia bacterium]
MKKTRLLALVLALSMVMTLFAGLSIAEEKPVLKVALTTSSMVTDYEDNYFTNYLEDKLGIEIEFQMLPVDAADTRQKIALLATDVKSPDLPDVFVVDNHLTTEGILSAGMNGLFLAVEDYANNPEAMPNYNAIPADDRAILDMASTQADGHMYSFPAYEPETWNYTPFRLFLNKAWLDKLGLQVPTTTEELKQVLIAFRDGDPNGNGKADEIGVYGYNGGYGQNTVAALMNSFVYWNNGQLNCGLALDESDYDTVYAPFTSDAWREGLRYLKDLYDEGVLSASIFTDNDTNFKAILNQEEPIVGLTSAGSLSNWPNAKENKNFLEMQLIAPLTGPEGVNYTPWIEQWPGQEMMICANTDKVDLAIKFADEFYDYETSLIERLGIEGTDWSRDPAQLEGQTNAYVEVGLTDSVKILITSSFWAENQNHTWRNHGPRYTSLATFLTIFDITNGPFNPDDPTQLNGKCYEQYFFNRPEKLLPMLKFTEDETEENLDALTYLGDFVKQAMAEFITGVRDIDNDWDAYLADLESYGLSQLIATTQAVYDRSK